MIMTQFTIFTNNNNAYIKQNYAKVNADKRRNIDLENP